MEMDEGYKNALMKVRASLGRWISPTGQWELLKEKQINANDPYPFEVVTGPERSYSSVRRYGSTLISMCSVIDSRREEGWILKEPQYPELQEHFRNGEPITSGIILGDFINSIETKVNKPQTGFEAMLEAFK